MSATNPTVALLVPCFDAADHLPQLIESARQQTRPFDQIICFDDGSSDGTRDVANNLGVQLLSSDENRGPSHARNRLAAAADTHFVHFHDADDAFHDRDFLMKMLDVADETTASFCNWLRISKDGSKKEFDYSDTNPDSDWAQFFIHRHVHLNAILFPRQFLIASGCQFDESFRIQEDLLFHLHTAVAGLKFANVPEPLASHTRRAGSTLDGWDPIAFHRKSLELCTAAEKFVKGANRAELGEKAIFHARALLDSGADWGIAQHGARIARRCGLGSSHSGGIAERTLSRLFGHAAGLRYFHARSRFNKQVRA